ncbi:MAG: hypothetical protein V1806_01875 [Pseudomonadota bacterium]
MNYGTYAVEQGKAIKASEETKTATANGLAEAVKSDDARTRDMGMLGLLVLALTHKPQGLEPPREGQVERGFGALLSGLPGVAQVLGLAHELKDAGGTRTASTVQQDVAVNGQGAGGGINTGAGPQAVSPATSPPTVVEQPPALVVGGD